MTVTVNHLRALLDLIPLDKDIGAAVEHAYTMVGSYTILEKRSLSSRGLLINTEATYLYSRTNTFLGSSA